MRTALCDDLGLEYPVLGFTPFPEVAAAISRAGGMGVLGAVRYQSGEEVDEALDWMDAHVGGHPYGVDVVMPAGDFGQHDIADMARLEAMIPERHRQFVDEVLERHGVPPLPEGERERAITGWIHSVARSQVEAALEHPIRMIANALGPPPADVITRAHERGLVVAALAGKAVHAERHRAAGVDVVVAQGYEAGGHTGEVATMVLVPEIVDAVHPTPVLAAGGIGSGRQIAAALALGAAGVWTGSIWLTTEEAALSDAVTDKLLRATSSDTVRSRVISGKPARMLRTAWTEAWEADDSPGALPLPLQGLLVAEANARIQRFEPEALLGIPVGQVVGSMGEVRTVADTMDRLVEEFDEAAARVGAARTTES